MLGMARSAEEELTGCAPDFPSKGGATCGVGPPARRLSPALPSGAIAVTDLDDRLTHYLVIALLAVSPTMTAAVWTWSGLS